jgi:SAM-dependent methyltransferase
MDLKCDYGKLAPSYDRYRDLSSDLLQSWLEVLIRWGRLSHGMRVLDIGCGTGRLTIPLQRLSGAEVWGLDLSEEMLAQAKRKEGAAAVRWVLGMPKPSPSLTAHSTLPSCAWSFITLRTRPARSLRWPGSSSPAGGA